MQYFENSSNIIVYPSVNRKNKADDTIGKESSKITEARITRMIMQLIPGRTGFVITDKLESITSTDSLDFVIQGYIFHIKSVENLLYFFRNYDTIYAMIKLRSISKVAKYQSEDYDEDYNVLDTYLQNEMNDFENKYLGVRFNNTQGTQSNYNLKILEKVEGEWRIPGNSKITFLPDYDPVNDIGKQVTIKYNESTKKYYLSWEAEKKNTLTNTKTTSLKTTKKAKTKKSNKKEDKK